MLRPFNSKNELNLIRNTAYSRFKPIPFVDVTINERSTRCRHIVNLNDIKSHSVSESESSSDSFWGYDICWTSVFITIHKSIDFNAWSRLSNIIFLQPGSTVIELMHPLMSAPFYRFLSHYASLNYILIKDVKPMNDSCVDRRFWSPYLSCNLQANVPTIIEAIKRISFN